MGSGGMGSGAGGPGMPGGAMGSGAMGSGAGAGSGMMGGMAGMAGGMGGGAAATAGPSNVPAVQIPAKTVVPLEVPRANPFEPAPDRATTFRTSATKYGPDWSRIPITVRPNLTFSQLTYPRTVVVPELPPSPSEAVARITGIIWADGSAMATYETTNPENGRRVSGVVRPGERIKGWEVVQIGENQVRVRNTETRQQQTLTLSGGAGSR